ncbi:MAG: class I SAM-dependent methyltransferase [Candidatus Obscuribacterales bacterium]|nr:class I SAM-dependent methyltransferase [Candidatus Obscuribacterales bacterium]
MTGLADAAIGPDWYKDFFHGVTLDFWRQAVPPVETEKEVQFLVDCLKVKPGSRLLDVPCGNGRHALALSKLGFNVTGIDISSEFIDEALEASTQAGAKVDFICEDMRNLPIDVAFDGAFCFGNSFGYFEQVGCEEFLEACSRSLRAGSRFLIDTGLVAEVLIPNFREVETFDAGDIKMSIQNRYHAESSCLETHFRFEHKGKIEERHALHFVFTTGEINRMLARNGFRLVSMYSSPDGEEFKLGAKRLLLLSEKA